MMQNYQALRLNISPNVILINLQVKVKENSKIKEKEFVDKSDFSGLIDNSDLEKKIAMLAAKA